MDKNYCKCKDCRKAWKRDKILGSRLLKYLGDNAYFVSAYVYRRKNI